MWFLGVCILCWVAVCRALMQTYSQCFGTWGRVVRSVVCSCWATPSVLVVVLHDRLTDRHLPSLLSRGCSLGCLFACSIKYTRTLPRCRVA